MKAILEISMPGNCYDCALSNLFEINMIYCPVIGCVFNIKEAERERNKNCPLELASDYFKRRLDETTNKIVDILNSK